MDTAVVIAQGVLGLVLAALNIVYWWFVMTRWQERFRRRCERRYGVVISVGGRGHWQVTGEGPWYRRIGIELLQLAYFMGAMVAWAGGLLLGVLLLWSLG